MKTLRKCRVCGREAHSENELELFKKAKNNAYGRDNLCKTCDKTLRSVYFSDETNNARARDSRLKHMYGISLDEYNRMLDEQNGVCMICKRTESCNDGRRFNVDHCHTTGEVRGLLCNNCNKGLGHFKYNTLLLHNAIKYLNKEMEC